MSTEMEILAQPGGSKNITQHASTLLFRYRAATAAVVAGAETQFYSNPGERDMKKLSVLAAVLLAMCGAGSSQTYTIDTVAGGGPDNAPATSVGTGFPTGVATDAHGNVYVALYSYGLIVRIDTTGMLTRIAGNGTPGYSGDGGPATSAQLYEPVDVAVDAAGNLYIADTKNFRIRKVSNGVITTVAGNGTAGYSGDGGPATSAELSALT